MFFFITNSRRTSTVQSRLFHATSIDNQYHSRITMSIKPNRRKDHMRKVLFRELMQQSEYKVNIFINPKMKIYICYVLSDGALSIAINQLKFLIYYLLALVLVIVSTCDYRSSQYFH